jgi:CheY-like chemotaxis protein
MPQGGRIVVETSEVEVNVETVNESMALERGSYVLLAIADTGAGMNEETRAHLFEPFYTTKQPGKGTGLGLSTVYGIVRHSRGHISVESLEGKGTTFRIYLPRVEQAVTKPVVVAAKPSPHLIGSATVLVVEDETALRRLLCMSLERRKHKVLAAKDGAEALELFREYASQVQLIITDLMMPRMDGLALKQNIAALNPQVKFLFMSGYAEEIVEQHRGSLEGCGFLEKPFLPEELADKVSQLLAGVVAA